MCDERDIEDVFNELHGEYGSGFYARVADGADNGGGKDSGLIAAAGRWFKRLHPFPRDLLMRGLDKAIEANPKFPPTPQQVRDECVKLMPRRWDRIESQAPRLPVSDSVRQEADKRARTALDEARELAARAKPMPRLFDSKAYLARIDGEGFKPGGAA